MNQDELNKILEAHMHWLREDVDGWKNMRANLSGASLSGANLSWADLSWADLSGANLSGANLWRANLSGANLSRANLSGADLSEANLSVASLSVASLSWANLSEADLSEANLSWANLSGADLWGANLSEANLSRAKNIEEAINLFIPYACPDTGSFIGWKRCRGGRIVKLEIPEDARRLSATGRKCRCDKAKVLAISDGTATYEDAQSIYDQDFTYRVGETVTAPDFDDNRWSECSGGIHFFITREEAERYSG